MRRELGWDDSLQCAKHTNPSNAGIRNRDSSERDVLVRICRELASGFAASSKSGPKFPTFQNRFGRLLEALRASQHHLDVERIYRTTGFLGRNHVTLIGSSGKRM